MSGLRLQPLRVPGVGMKALGHPGPSAGGAQDLRGNRQGSTRQQARPRRGEKWGSDARGRRVSLGAGTPARELGGAAECPSAREEICVWEFPTPAGSFPGGSVVKNLPAHAGDTGNTGSIPGSGRSSGEGNGNPLQDSCWENSMDRGAWWATLHAGHKESDTTERLSNNAGKRQIRGGDKRQISRERKRQRNVTYQPLQRINVSEICKHSAV